MKNTTVLVHSALLCFNSMSVLFVTLKKTDLAASELVDQLNECEPLVCGRQGGD